MNRKLLTSLITACAALALPGSALAVPKIDGEFALSAQPRHLAQGPDGNVWVAMGTKVAKVTPAGAVTEFDPTDIDSAEGITTGPDGNLWVTQTGGVAKFAPANPDGATKFAIGAIAGGQAITTGPDGNLWTASNDKVVKIPPANPTGATDKSITGMGARGISRSGNRLWVADFAQKQVHSVTTDFGVITPHTVGGAPQETAGGPGGQAAYSAPATEVGRLTQGATALKSLSGPDPFGIAFASSDSGYWFAEFAAQTVGRMGTDGKVTHPVGKFTPGSGPRYLTTGPNNTLWVGLEQTKKIGRITGVTPAPAQPAGKPAGGKPGARDRVAPAITRLSVGRTKVRFRLSEKASVRIAIKRRHHRAKTITRRGRAGRNAVRFRRLRAGSYRVTVTAKDAFGNKSRTRRARLSLKR